MGLHKVELLVNGVQRLMHVDENESLAELLRRYGLTGVKIGCGIGVCGSCTVLLNGEPVRSCARKAASLPDFSSVETIEGLGTASNLHPLQLAFITRGSVQCGFCTPGFIVSAKGLLDKNPNPTRDEVRDWFTRHRNICRCTGYKQIVDAVMDAAQVMRGEMTMKELEFRMPDGGGVYGTDYPRPFALGRVLGVTDYGEDMGDKMPAGTYHLALVFAEVGAGKLLSLDTAEAEKAPGVAKVITVADIKGSNNIARDVLHPRSKAPEVERNIIVKEIIRKKGDVLAVVAADTREHARAAAKLVKADIRELPSSVTLLDAVLPDALSVQGDAPNHFLTQPVFKGEDTAPIFDEAPYVVEGSFYSSREPHLPIEPHSMQAYREEDGTLTICVKSQFVHGPTFGLPFALGLPPGTVRVINNPVGGIFGLGMAADAAGIVGAASLALDGAPVTLTLTYREFQLFSGKRAPSYSNGRVACDENGKILACELDIAQDHGAYPETAGILLTKTMRFMGYGLNIPNITAIGRAVFTNNSYAIPYRSFGSPQMYTAMEQLIDMLAKKAGMDPFDFRRLNAIKPGDTTPNSRPYHYYSVEELLEKLRPYWEESKKWKAEDPQNGKIRGIGVAMGGFHVSEDSDLCEVWLELNPDGTVTNYNCWQELGQGGDAGSVALTVEALKPLGIGPDRIRLLKDDTGRAPFHGPSAASRSHYASGNATRIAAELMLDAMRKEDGAYRTYAEMKAEGIETVFKGKWEAAGNREPIDPNTGEGNAMQDHNHIVQACRVEVDPMTGKVDVVSVHASADVGVIGNKLTVEGQAIGGLEHAIGFALYEEYSDFEKKYENMAGCGTLQCGQMPDDVEFTFVETPREGGPFGSGGASECFQSCGHAVILNAINDALGIRIYELPATPERILAALDARKEGKELKPGKWYLGEDFSDIVADIRANPILPQDGDGAAVIM
ncbi:MAG: molybdopterin-dependent oxidoreductase [Clostridiales Family XIII bacterium]|jgi:aldehyde oxidoreductase|nr:molybdopterin-dependent oxidoreductase [Clostridiales Family XIII bacterium]